MFDGFVIVYVVVDGGVGFELVVGGGVVVELGVKKENLLCRVVVDCCV